MPRKTALGLVAFILAAGLASPALIANAAAAGKGGGARAPGPRAAAITTQSQIDRNRQVVRTPTKAYNDKKCQRVPRPHSCNWQHQH